MLHSILFLGNIHPAQYNPKDIFAETEVFKKTMDDFPASFKYYQTHVAKRTPFSYFLELVTICYDENNENMVKGKLCEILRGCKKSGDQYPLISVVICICERGESRYYGASLSCESDREREIMTSVSCLHVWDRLVSFAVMSVFSADPGGVRTIQFQCQCRAYALENMEQEKPPCGRCSQLYSLPNPDPEDIDFRNPAGNCAETEAISNLLLQKNSGVITEGVYEHQVIEEVMTACFNRNINEIMEKRGRGNRNEYNINTFYP
ncbi:uncharacterized protein LOC128515995 [Clarias gariepinus]|uniref:uncharacterized protein LOC128515995 n=1 Tax=Clarias gariepinus TaxID=13013 RepID=UPI00234DDBCB|nr:uncharacterized protein LOC128515995 [Clarias gariepinus]